MYKIQSSKLFSLKFPKFLLNAKFISFQVEEVKIPLGNGDIHLAGKFWGDKTKKPILCLHGAQDNAGSFDRLIPLLPKSHSYLAVDLFGHGLSSTLPRGLQFDVINYLHHINELRKILNIEKLSLIGHSSSGNFSLVYGALFPENVKMIIDLDDRKPTPESQEVSTEFLQFLMKFYKAEEKNRKNLKILFKFEDLCERYEQATGGNISKEIAPFLLKRQILKCENSEKFHLTHDNRITLETVTGFHLFQKFHENMARRINFPLMIIECLRNPIFGWKTFHGDVLEILKENENYEHHKIDGNHHVHLTEPEKISEIVSEFILKHGERVEGKL